MASPKQIKALPKSSPRVQAAKRRYDPSAQSLAQDLLRKKGQGHFRWKKN